jgi:hypothetical protein
MLRPFLPWLPGRKPGRVRREGIRGQSPRGTIARASEWARRKRAG